MVLKAVLQGLDPASLPDESVGFSDTILGITFHGSASVCIYSSLLIHSPCEMMSIIDYLSYNFKNLNCYIL